MVLLGSSVISETYRQWSGLDFFLKKAKKLYIPIFYKNLDSDLIIFLISIPQILREINSNNSRSAKSPIRYISEVLNFNFSKILHFLKAEIHQIN